MTENKFERGKVSVRESANNGKVKVRVSVSAVYGIARNLKEKYQVEKANRRRLQSLSRKRLMDKHVDKW